MKIKANSIKYSEIAAIYSFYNLKPNWNLCENLYFASWKLETLLFICLFTGTVVFIFRA